MFSWLKRKSPEPEAKVISPRIPKTLPPKTSKLIGDVKYNPKLVGQLSNEMKRIIETYAEILHLLNSKYFAKIPPKLRQLTADLKAHIFKEELELYSYLEKIFSSNPQTLEDINKIKQEIDHIAEQIVNLMNHYEELDQNNAQTFKTEFELVGELLATRFHKKEEILYTMYTLYK